MVNATTGLAAAFVALWLAVPPAASRRKDRPDCSDFPRNVTRDGISSDMAGLAGEMAVSAGSAMVRLKEPIPDREKADLLYSLRYSRNPQAVKCLLDNLQFRYSPPPDPNDPLASHGLEFEYEDHPSFWALWRHGPEIIPPLVDRYVRDEKPNHMIAAVLRRKDLAPDAYFYIAGRLAVYGDQYPNRERAKKLMDAIRVPATAMAAPYPPRGLKE